MAWGKGNNTTTKQPAPKERKDIWSAPVIDSQLLSLCFDKSNSSDVGQVLLSLNIVMKKI